MKKELEYMTIEYNTYDTSYINDVIKILTEEIDRIIEFFGFKDFGTKVRVRIWKDVEKYRSVFTLKKTNIIGIRQIINKNSIIEIVSLKELIKIDYHKKTTILDFTHLILHEFVHECHCRYTTRKSYIWLWEGMATYLSKQYKKVSNFNSSLEEMKVRNNTDYHNFYTMFYYVYQAYGKKYILNLLNNFKLQEKDTPRLYKETKKFVEELEL